MFRGLYESTVDAKGRTSFPAKFRDAVVQRNEALCHDALRLGDDKAKACEKFILTTGIDRCLVVYTVDEWLEFENKLKKLPQFDPAVVQLKRLIVAAATECALDKNGRLHIPQLLREYASIDREVVWAGTLTTIELWSKDKWQEIREGADLANIAKSLTELGL